jgi:16S rRNA (cytosine967-C5)-methyltransferase
VLGAKEGETVVDMCSAPGSKSFGAAIDMNNKGKIYSFDLHSSKLPLIEKGGARLGIDIISVAEGDGTVFRPELASKADRVICDVPCSGFGVCGKKPEIRYKDIEESRDLADIQLQIAENGAKYLRDGGTMVYSTCTILPEENLDNVKRLLEKCPELSLEPFEVFGLRADEGYLTLTPDEHGTDGFFIARLRKGSKN